MKQLLSILSPSSPESLQTVLTRMTDTDWEDIIHRSNRHSITPILHKRLEEISDKCEIPTEIIEKIENYYLLNLSRNIRIQHNLGKIIKSFNEAGMEAIVLKGAYLSEAVYEDIAMRTMSDMDVLVKSSDVSQAEQLILSLGYIPHRNNPQLGISCNHYVYQRQNDSTPLELHWHILHLPFSDSISIQDIWDRAYRTEVNGIKTLVQSPEDLLIHICFHTAFMHTFSQCGLRMLWDIRVILKHFAGRLNWEQIKRTASDWGVTRSVYLTLATAEEVLNMRMPEGVLKMFRDSRNTGENKAMPLEEEHIRTAIEQIQLDLPIGSGLSKYLAFFWCSNNTGGAARILLNRLFPSPSEMRKMYSLKSNTAIVYLYYFKRVWNLFRDHGRAVILLLRRNPETVEKARSEKRRHLMREWMIKEVTK
ncbi:nucleotidyltransferase family protein [bacterium]|nr:nucleotidyltransferase family protein [bacterium]